jgi:hypothetical protein
VAVIVRHVARPSSPVGGDGIKANKRDGNAERGHPKFERFIVPHSYTRGRCAWDIPTNNQGRRVVPFSAS